MSDILAQFADGYAHVGSIPQLASVHIFGLAYYTPTGNTEYAATVYLSAAGPTTALQAVYAQLAAGKQVFASVEGMPRGFVIRHPLASVRPEESSGNPYLRFARRLPGLGIDHLILLDRRIAQPLYAETSLTFAFELPGWESILGEHIRSLVDISVLPEWFPALAEWGLAEGLVQPCSGPHRPALLRVSLDKRRWTAAISTQLHKGELAWPA